MADNDPSSLPQLTSLIEAITAPAGQADVLPYAVYSSVHEQVIVNVPVIKPTLILVLQGNKSLEFDGVWECGCGEFVFLSNRPAIAMRNIPADSDYLALLIEFEFDDFEVLPQQGRGSQPLFTGRMDQVLINTLQQLVEWSHYAPASLWASRRRELLLLMYQAGFPQVCQVALPPTLSHQLYQRISAQLDSAPHAEQSATELASMLAMSEATLRRKLAAEHNSLTAIRDSVRMGRGLHLLQTTMAPIGRIAESCGYQSQSRFSERFRQRFGLTPSELRKTRMIESGE